MTSIRFPTRTGIPNAELFQKGCQRLPTVLAQMGFDSLRKGQDEVIMNIMAQIDTLCIMSTSAGKSACFLIPTLCNEWKTLVISPLVALMRDQVKSCWNKGISAGQLTGMQTDAENASVIKQWVNNKLQVLFLAPERLQNEMFQAAMKAVKPNMIALDEAHCLSQNGDNFRPAYKAVGDFIRDFDPDVVTAFTATCPAEVEKDIRHVCGLEKASRVIYYPRRENLILSSSYMDHELDIVARVKKSKGPVLIYSSTIKRLEELVYTMQNLMSENVGYFHGSLADNTKKTMQDMFIDGKLRVMVATKAFGMGVDLPGLRNVINYDLPGTLEDLSQQDGRAGRDGKESWCHTFVSDAGIRTQEFFIRTGNPSAEDVIGVYQTLLGKADNQGRVECSVKKLAYDSHTNYDLINAVLAQLTGAQVIRRSKDRSTIGKIRFLKSVAEDSRYSLWAEKIEEGGVVGADGVIEVDMEWLYQALGYTSNTTVTKWLKQWQDEQRLVYIPPPRSAPIEIIGGTDRIDFHRLKVKAEEARTKLDQVLEYCSTPDEEKHAFLEKHLTPQ